MIRNLEEESVALQLAVARISASDPNPGLRNEAAIIFAYHGTSLDAFRLRQLLVDEDWIVRSSAAEAVEQVFGKKKAEKELLPMLEDKHHIVRRDAAVFLGDLNFEHLVAPLQERLASETHEQALLGLWHALVALGERQYLEPILALYDSEGPGMRAAVWNTVSELIDVGPLTSEELAMVQEGMKKARGLLLSHSVLYPMDEVEKQLAEMFPQEI